VVANGRVLVGTNNEQPRDPRYRGDRGVLMCFKEEDGTFLWQLLVPKREDRLTDWPRTGICSSPVVDGQRVYLLSNRGEVLCLDLNGQADGNDGPFRDENRFMASKGEAPIDVGPRDADILWRFDLEALGVHQHDAAHSSALVHGPLLYVNTCNGVSNSHFEMPAPDAPSLVVLDKTTGRLVAKDEERMGVRTIHCTWSSPSTARVNGRELVFFGGGDAVCYAFEALGSAPPPGEVLGLKKVWFFDCDPASPRENILDWQDNRREGPSTISGMPVFHEGRIYVTAGGDYWHGKKDAWLKCIRADGQGDITRTGEAWSYLLDKYCLSTPAVHDGLTYIGDCGRTLHCVDNRTGRAVWKQDLEGEEAWASPLVADGKVYIGTRGGTLWILAAGREKKVMAKIKVGTPLDASPVAANGTLYITAMNRLYALHTSSD
jgi:outer membrane protein assembly factor BamB